MDCEYALVNRLGVTGERKSIRSGDLWVFRGTKSSCFCYCHPADGIDYLLLDVGTLSTYVQTYMGLVRNDIVFQTSINKSDSDDSRNVSCKLSRTNGLQFHN